VNKALFGIICVITLSILLSSISEVYALTNVVSCGTLNIPNEDYVLVNDIESSGSCITISADGITFNGNNQKIFGSWTQGNPGSFTEAVLIGDVQEVTIKNVIIDSVSFGIHLDNSNENFVIDNTVLDSGVGIQLDFSDNNEISSNTITQSGGSYGIRLDRSNGNLIIGNAQSGTGNGLVTTNSFSGTIRDNSFESNTSQGIYLIGVGNYIVTENQLKYNDQGRIRVGS